ncbi:hypothetical protein HDF09_002367 [Edaphobacter lichenicola]|uniref:Uncharacterized protein n=1 Tax=Tunturiibacter empetritectus TaxID=3069691 RepID=A0A7W8MRC0_9BACT|nr:hypothetical protein [Edaphobacter lichenicola]
MIKRITLSVVLALLLACLLTAAGVLGSFSPLIHIMEPGSLLCRRFFGSQFTGDIEGDMITTVIWLNVAVYTLLLFPVLLFTLKRIRRTETA